MKTIYFIRHGQTNSNIHRLTGTPTDPLTDLGVQQAGLIAKRLKGNIHVQAILCSTYTRAMQTVVPIAEALGVEPEYSDLLIECKRPEVIQGKALSDPEVKDIADLCEKNWGNPDWHHSTEENYFDLSDRACKVLQWLADRPENDILVVSHGAFIHMLVEIILLGEHITPTLAISLYYALDLGNTGVTVLTYNENKKWVLVRWNDTAHLEPETQSV